MTPNPTAWQRLAEGIWRASFATGWPSSRRQESIALAVTTLVLAFLTWPVTEFLPANGLDPSWIAGLQMDASGSGPASGEPLVFTYGPLGFLLVPQLWVGGPFVLAFFTAVAIQLALIATLLVGVRRSFPWIPSVALVFVLGMIAGGAAGVAPSRAFILAVLVAVWVALSTWRGRWAWVMPVITGALCGALALANLGMGVGATILVAIASTATVTARRYLPPLIHLASALATMLILWVIVVGDLAALPRWIRLSADVVLGYPAAMTYQAPATDWYWLFIAAMVAVLVFELVWFAQRAPLARWLPLALIVGLGVFLLTQKHMVRSGDGHMLPLVFALGGLVVTIPVERRRLAVPALAGVFAVLAHWVVLPTALTQPLRLDPVARVQAFGQQARAATSPSHRDALVANGRSLLEGVYGLSPRLRAAIGDEPVVIDPFEIGVAWTYGLNWEPVPILQPYSAYTRRLDEANADAIATGDAERLLMQVKPFNAEYAGLGLDGRRLDADSPAYNLAIVCNFAPLANDDRWIVYERVPSRCGEPRPLGPAISAQPGVPVKVPLPPERAAVVYARIDAQLPLRGRLVARAWVPRWVPSIVIDGGLVNRFILATGTSTWLMRVPPPLSPSLHDPQASQVSQFVVNDVASPYSVRFFWLPVVRADGTERPWALPVGGG